MIYPIGHSTLALRFEQPARGSLKAEGIAVTDDEGWIEVPMPPEATAAGAPTVVAIQVRAERVGGGRWFMAATALDVAGERFVTLFDLLNSPARAWLSALGPALDAAIAVRVQQAQRAQSGFHVAVRESEPDRPGAGDNAAVSGVKSPRG